ncbi:NUDIX hydrolase [Nakamurella sp. A5-74]|uniref:NUDIX hydrolase n=1 Tax=Nakamurella sp. A5-74 TaxID=3158264 RepID=A0AAU8DUX9_9ACTN
MAKKEQDLPAVTGAGGVLWRHTERHGIRIAVVHRPRYSDWSLPKGKVKHRESVQQTALREITEETGFAGVLGRVVGRARYEVAAGPKEVTYFSVRAGRGRFHPNAEVDRLEWVTPEQAIDRLDYPDEIGAVGDFASVPVDLSTMVVVRHARAGKRETFDGDDVSRPLDAKGRAQADSLQHILDAYAPERLVSAPAVRCVQTLKPTATRCALSIEIDGGLGEERYRDEPAAARRLIRTLLAGNPTTRFVMCSQGGVIPGALRSLATSAELHLPDVSTPKAAHWVLTFDGERLIQADRHPAPIVTPLD